MTFPSPAHTTAPQREATLSSLLPRWREELAERQRHLGEVDAEIRRKHGERPLELEVLVDGLGPERTAAPMRIALARTLRRLPFIQSSFMQSSLVQSSFVRGEIERHPILLLEPILTEELVDELLDIALLKRKEEHAQRVKEILSH